MHPLDTHADGCCKKTGQRAQFGGEGVKNVHTQCIDFFTRQRALRALRGHAAAHTSSLVAVGKRERVAGALAAAREWVHSDDC